MRTRQVGWMFHEERGRHYHQLFVPSGKIPPNLTVDAINWDAPIADELANTDIDYADSISLKIGADSVNCCEPTKTPGQQARHRKAESPDAWVFKTDRSSEIAERYRETLEWVRTIEAIYWEEESKWDEKQRRKEHEALYVQLTEKQRAQQAKRNQLMADDEAAEKREKANRNDFPMLPTSRIQFIDGPMAGQILPLLPLEEKFPNIYGCDAKRESFFAYRLKQLLQFEGWRTAVYTAFPDEWVGQHKQWLDSHGLRGPWEVLKTEPALPSSKNLITIDPVADAMGVA